MNRNIIHQLTTAELAATYNLVPGVRQVSRFSDASTGRKRLELALETAKVKLTWEAKTREIRVVHLDAPAYNNMKYPCTRKITRITQDNPRQKRGASWHRFELYRTGMTVEDYVTGAAALGVTRRKALFDIRCDSKNGHISLED